MSLMSSLARPVLMIALSLASTFAAAADGHSSRTALDWEGRYRGTLPCADCEGIRTTITLQANGRYSQTSVYLGRKGRFSEAGRYVWNRAGSRITLTGPGGERTRYIVGEGHLIQLQANGRPVTGPLARHYRFSKVR